MCQMEDFTDVALASDYNDDYDDHGKKAKVKKKQGKVFTLSLVYKQKNKSKTKNENGNRKSEKP